MTYDLLSEISDLRSYLTNKNDMINDKDKSMNEFKSILDSQKEKYKDLSNGQDELLQLNEVLKGCNKQLNEQY